ncbi:uncharacterized protein LOC130702397 [Daphnia carinata]|uniref:uncharacterized protein LOC130702397 n=1 Tax=Daphnia carinata TaxID=120202 RepID=UPI002868EA25|nr:uncharacterized protein LOC130702397 [Daphnia carinata]
MLLTLLLFFRRKMYSIPVINLPDEWDEESEETEEEVSQTLDEGEEDDDETLYPITHRDASTATDEDVDQKTDGRIQRKSKKIGSSLKNVAEQIVHQHRKLLNKHEVLLGKRRATLQNISLLHDKLLNIWNEKMKSQHEYGYQYLRSIENSQTTWQSKMTESCKRNDLASSNGHKQTGDETVVQIHRRSSKQEVERLGRDLLDSSEKRLKTLEEVVSLISKELEEAKKECGILDKELAETVIYLEEKEEMLKMINESEETEVADGKVHSRGMSMQSNGSNRNKMIHRSPPQPYTFKSEREITEFFVEKRSTAIYPAYGSNSGNNKQEVPSVSTNSHRSSYSTASCSFPADQSCFGDNASSRSSEAESTDNNHTLTPKYRYSYFYGTGNRPSCSSTAISHNHASEPPKKRGRPRKLPDVGRLPVDASESCKKKRGRPRKYLKLELTRISSTI